MDDLKHPFKPMSYKGDIGIGIINMFVVLLCLVVSPHQWIMALISFLNGIIFIGSGLFKKQKTQRKKDSK